MSDIIANPKLTLYAFHLRNNLAQGALEPESNADRLWEECRRLGQKLRVPRLESLIERLRGSNGKIGVPPDKDNPLSDYIELLPQQRLLSFSAVPDGSHLQLRGEVYPLQIHDTYAVDITLRYPYPNVNISQLSSLNHQGCLLPSQIKASLGQTLVLFAQPVGEISDTQAFANACLAAILPQTEVGQFLLSPPNKGKFLGSPIFEYENNQDNSTEHIHILIWLNCHPQTESLEAAGNYYQSLLNLLCCRSKILYAYSESRWCNQQARLLYEKLETKVKGFRQLSSAPAEKLNQLKEWLTEIPQTTFEYANHLRDLEFHRTTIQTNSKNYRFWLNKLQAISLKEYDDLELWHHFLNRTQDKFIDQISVDSAYLIPGKQLFQEMIATIRGIVEIEQAESDRQTQKILRQKEEADKVRDRDLQTTIAMVGVGLGAAGIGASTAPYIIPQQPTKPILQPFASNQLHPLTQSLLFSLFCGVVGAIVAGGLSYLIQNRGAIAGRVINYYRRDSGKQ